MTRQYNLPTQAEIRRLLCYNPLSGNFMWKVSPNNRIHIGDLAGTILRDRNGRLYRRIRVNRHKYMSHRLAFLYIRGYWPLLIDHKDGDGLNNCWLNLRECTNAQNLANRGPNKNNKLGIKGVSQIESGKYLVQIGFNNKRIFLGKYKNLSSATCAYQKAAKKYFGEFASW